MAKENTVLAIDIGGDTLKMAEFTFPAAGGLRLEKFAFMEYDPELKEAKFSEVFSRLYQQMLTEYKFVSKGVRISISGQSAFTRLSKLPPLGDDKARIEQVVEYEAKQTVPYPMNEVICDYQLVKHTIQSAAKTEIPPPADGEQTPQPEPEIEAIDEMEALFVAVKNDVVVEITDIIQASGKDIISIEIAPTASFNAARANQIGVNQCDVILNIGGRCSSLIFADQCRIFARTIPIAGHSITQQISKEFNISFADAEELKRRHGFVALGGAYEEPDSEVSATVSKIARNVMTRLHGEINRSINVWRSQYGGNKPAHLYLSGGSSLMAYTPRFFNEKLRIPVDYLNVFQIVSIGSEINKEQLLEVAPMFAELIGLGLKHIVDCPVDINLMPSSIKKYKALQRRKPYFFASCAAVVMLLVVLYIGVTKRLSFDKDRVEFAKKEVEKTNVMVDKVKALNRDLLAAKSEYDEAVDVLRKRQQWIKLINDFEGSLPDRVWLTLFEGIGELSSNQKAAATPKRGGRGGGAPGGAPGGKGGAKPGGAAPPPMAGPEVDMPQQVVQSQIQEINYIRVAGHSLVLIRNELLEEELKLSLKKMPFVVEGEESVIFENYVPQKGKNNLTSFNLRIKLKEPIKK
jgi:type IV pilus assembly protein PilM